MLPAPRARRRLATWTATLALAGLLTLTGAGAAFAHDQLVETDPADGEVLDHAPEALALTFSAELLDISATVLVTGPQGAVPSTVEVDGPVVRAALPAGLTAGEYTVAWRVVSGDGHPIQGAYGFAISTDEPATISTDEPATTPTSTPTSTDDPPPSATTAPEPASPAAPSPAASGAAWLAGGAVLAALLVAAVVARRASRRRPS